MNYPSPPKTTFITFYSFKGGVGRTMALVNAACILAGRGRRVLMIDFDLEAPGLTTLKDFTQATASQGGLVELIHEFLSDTHASPLMDAEDRGRFRERYVAQLEIPEHLRRLDTGCLELMPCGRLDDGYMKRLNDIDFRALYSEGIGQPLFKLLKKVIGESGLYDYVLIDARTGLSDEGGICTRDLADHICVIMGLNRQNVEGTAQFLQRLRASGWEEGEVIFVASPVPTGLEELRDQRLNAAREALSKADFRSDFKLRVPYHPRLALDEEPFLYRWSETDLFPSYELIAQELQRLADDTPQRRWTTVRDAVREGKYPEALNGIRQLYADEPGLAVTLLSDVTQELAQSSADVRRRADAFYRLWISLTDDIVAKYEYSTYLIRMGNFPQSFNVVNQLREQVSARTFPSFRDVQCTVGVLLFMRGLYDEAVDIFSSLQSDGTDDITTGAARGYLANIYEQQEELEKAATTLHDLLPFFSQRQSLYNVAATLAGLGVVKIKQGKFDDGFESIERSNAIARQLGQEGKISQNHLYYTEGLFRRDGVTPALNYLTSHWDFIIQYAEADTVAEAHLLRGKLKSQLGDREGAAEDAKVALEFYRRNDVRTRSAQEAAELAGDAAS